MYHNYILLSILIKNKIVFYIWYFSIKSKSTHFIFPRQALTALGWKKRQQICMLVMSTLKCNLADLWKVPDTWGSQDSYTFFRFTVFHGRLPFPFSICSGDMVTWILRYRNMDMETWKHGDIATLDMETWRNGENFVKYRISDIARNVSPILGIISDLLPFSLMSEWSHIGLSQVPVCADSGMPSYGQTLISGHWYESAQNPFSGTTCHLPS